MSFLLRCPHCGERSVYEFRFGGEVKARPAPGASDDDWVGYRYIKANEAGVQKEWWYHRDGCQQWIVATRNTITNQALETSFPEETP
jgi:heterotetrameric sarcosine oxidase delta subunit